MADRERRFGVDKPSAMLRSNPICGNNYALFYCRFGNLTRSYQIQLRPKSRYLARRPELPDEQVVRSHPVIHLPSMRPQCTQHLTFTCALLDRRLFHPHRLRSTVTGPYESV